MEILEGEGTESICVEIENYLDIRKPDIVSFFQG